MKGWYLLDGQVRLDSGIRGVKKHKILFEVTGATYVEVCKSNMCDVLFVHGKLNSHVRVIFEFKFKATRCHSPVTLTTVT